MNLRQVKGKYLGAGGAGVYPLSPAGRRPLRPAGHRTGSGAGGAGAGPLLDHGLTPAGIPCSHAHVDHGGNNRYFSGEIPHPRGPHLSGGWDVRQPAEPEVLFSAPLPGHGGAGRRRTGPYAGRAHPRWGRPFSFAGREFQILRPRDTPLGIFPPLTPDGGVLWGTPFSPGEQLDAKLPYCLSHRMGMESRRSCGGWTVTL